MATPESGSNQGGWIPPVERETLLARGDELAEYVRAVEDTPDVEQKFPWMAEPAPNRDKEDNKTFPPH